MESIGVSTVNEVYFTKNCICKLCCLIFKLEISTFFIGGKPSVIYDVQVREMEKHNLSNRNEKRT